MDFKCQICKMKTRTNSDELNENLKKNKLRPVVSKVTI